MRSIGGECTSRASVHQFIQLNLLTLGIFLGLSITFRLHASSNLTDQIDLKQLSAMDEESVDELNLDFAKYYHERQQHPSKTTMAEEQSGLRMNLLGEDDPSPEDLDKFFQNDPSNKPIQYDGSFSFPFPIGGTSSSRGAAYIIAQEVLFQTLEFYGVVPLIRVVDSKLEFKILESKSGYFRNLSKLQVAYALREFARFLNAHLCNDASQENFYKAIIVQVPIEQIGLRFKNDMTWALLENPLPRDPNSSLVLGRKWAALGKLVGGSTLIQNQTEKKSDVKEILDRLTDIVGLMQNLNKIMCFVDIMPKAKEELRKRLVNKALLDLIRKMEDRADALEELYKQASDEGVDQMLESIRTED